LCESSGKKIKINKKQQNNCLVKVYFYKAIFIFSPNIIFINIKLGFAVVS